MCLSDDHYQSSSGPSYKYESTYVTVCVSEDYHLSSSGFYWNIRVPTLLSLSLKTIISHHQVPTANMRVCTFVWPIPVATLSKVWVYCRSIAGIVGSNTSGVWMSVSCECCVWSGRSLCDGSITRREKSYRVWCVWVSSRNLKQEAQTHYGCPVMTGKKTLVRISLKTITGHRLDVLGYKPFWNKQE